MTIQVKDNGNTAEMLLYGEVLSSTPRNWWTDEKIEGDFIDLPTFKEELAKIENKDRIDFYINSVGGDYYAGLAIYNKIKQLKCEVNIIVDGLAASAASIIAMAGKLKMCTGSVLMVHPPSCLLLGYYNKQELNEINKRFDTVTKSAISVYSSKNTLKSKEEIEELMNNTTWLVDNEAVEYGFADELYEKEKSVEFKLSANGSTVIVNGIKHNAKYFSEDFTKNLAQENKGIADRFTDMCNKVATVLNIDGKSTQKGKENEIMCKTVEELKEKFPELTNQLIESVKSEEKTSVQEEIKNAVLSERKRIEEIEQIENSIADKELLNKAKFSAEETMNAKELAFEAMKAQGVKNTEYLNNLDKDNADSKVNDVKTEAPKVETINEKDAAVESMTKIFQSIKK